MKRSLWWMGGLLREAAGEDGAPSGSGDPNPNPAASNPAAFDQAKFRTELLGDIKKLLKKEAPVVDPEPPPAADPAPPAADPAPAPKPDARTQVHEKQMAEMQRKLDLLKKEADEKEQKAKERTRQADIRSALIKAGVNEKYLETAIRSFSPEVIYDDDGTGENLIGPDGSSLSDYAKIWLKLNDNFLPPIPSGGAGAAPGSQPKASKGPDINEIKPGMKPEEKKAYWDAIASAVRG